MLYFFCCKRIKKKTFCFEKYIIYKIPINNLFYYTLYIYITDKISFVQSHFNSIFSQWPNKL